MTQQELERRRRYPSIFALDRELEESLREDRERERQERIRRRILYSDEPADRLAVKAVAFGLLSYAQCETVTYSSYYRHHKGWFGHTTDEEHTNKQIRRVIAER